ncbi:MAG: hypothetical protein HGB34_02070 [Candidatus Moranbacteria bacterium]|nr:hypothetical protein [Candidatus Moranbacteria bacterium]NTW75665.1 hypothetical protein [Candidatus Moranbacteria bacterium]
MKLEVKSLSADPVTVLRRLGYVFQRKDGAEMSFVRPLSSSGYPRFHCYARIEGASLLINFHLDQKRETYGEGTRHHGEYENEGALTQEADRMIGLLGSGARIIA